MNYRPLGHSGIKVPELSFGTGTFGDGSNDFFKAWGVVQDKEAQHLLDVCMEAGCNLFDTADIYSDGQSEIALGKAISHLKRDDILLSTKATFRSGKGPNDVGSSRYHLTAALEGSLKRLNTDYIDIYHLHAFDATTPVEETLNTLDKFVREGKVRYIACSNFSGWHLLQALGYPFHNGVDDAVEGAEILIRFYPNSNPQQLFFHSQEALDAAALKLGLSKGFTSESKQ